MRLSAKGYALDDFLQLGSPKRDLPHERFVRAHERQLMHKQIISMDLPARALEFGRPPTASFPGSL